MGKEASSQRKRPNILFILSDDQGAWAMGCAGNRDIITPNLDELARTGLRFENAFCASPVCSPARASILTGKMPSQHGVQDWIRRGHFGPEAIDYLRGQLTLPEILSANGYACALSGKWHLGDVSTVKNRFPDHVYAHQRGSGNYYNAPMYRDGMFVQEPGYITDLITDDAIGYMDRAAAGDRPFFLCVHYTAPHNPWIDGNHPAPILSLYDGCGFSQTPQGRVHPDAVYRYSVPDALECLKGYYAAVTAMDSNIGRLVRRLDELGLREDTLLIFTSDNGFNCGHHGIWGKGNGTFSLNMFDTSIKVPLIVSQPGRVPAGRVTEEMVSQYDYLPTLLDYLGIAVPPGLTSLPGRSFLPLLDGRQTGGHDYLVVYDEYGPVRMIRTKRWKYVHRYAGGSHELYDLWQDPGEEHDLYGCEQYREKAAELRQTLFDWFRDHTDPVLDGSKQPVRGNGQIGAIRSMAPGQTAFDQDRRIMTSPSGDPGNPQSQRQRTK